MGARLEVEYAAILVLVGWQAGFLARGVVFAGSRHRAKYVKSWPSSRHAFAKEVSAPHKGASEIACLLHFGSRWASSALCCPALERSLYTLRSLVSPQSMTHDPGNHWTLRKKLLWYRTCCLKMTLERCRVPIMTADLVGRTFDYVGMIKLLD